MFKSLIRNTFKEHIISHAIEETSVECVVCGIGFNNQEKFSKHIQLVHERSNHEDLNNPPTRLYSNGNNKETSRVTKNLRCFVCDERCSDEHELDTHRLIHHCKVPKGSKFHH